MQEQNENRPLFYLSLLTAAATFPLIFMGGLVTSYGAGMSVPDWPNSFGYNMFAFPPSQWVGQIWYEHTHRLAGSGIGLLTILIVVLAWTTDKRKWVRYTSLWLLLAVCVQGVLGGLRVIFVNLNLAIVHGISGQLFFCFAATYALMTSRLWSHRPTLDETQRRSLTFLSKLAAVASGVVVLQLIIGTVMRQFGAGLAIPDFPLSYGRVLPPTSIDATFRKTMGERFGPLVGMNFVTLFNIWIHFAHRMGALLVTIAIVTLSMVIFVKHRDRKPLVISAIALLALLATQVTLGILTVLWRKPADIASLHVAVGALVLMTTWITFMQTYGLIRPAVKKNVERGAFPVKPMAGGLNLKFEI